MIDKYVVGKRVRTADLFTKFTGLWGHEEFEARGHKLLSLKLGTVSADYREGEPIQKILTAKDFGLRLAAEIRIRSKHENTLVVPVLNFDMDRGTRPHLRKLHRTLTNSIRKTGRKILRGGNISWNIEHFTTQKAFMAFKWVVENLGTRKEPVYVPLLFKIGRRDAATYDITEQTKAADGMFEARCELVKETINRLKCNGI